MADKPCTGCKFYKHARGRVPVCELYSRGNPTRCVDFTKPVESIIKPIRLSLTHYRDHPKERKHQKYRNKVTETADGRFDSEAEYRHWCHLKLRLKVGEISNLRRQVVFELIPSQKRPSGGTERACNYIADFVYQEGGRMVCADVKGCATGEYIIKRKLMLHVHGVEISEVRA